MTNGIRPNLDLLWKESRRKGSQFFVVHNYSLLPRLIPEMNYTWRWKSKNEIRDTQIVERMNLHH